MYVRDGGECLKVISGVAGRGMERSRGGSDEKSPGRKEADRTWSVHVPP